ncbi:hypothetical protein Cal6303_5546 [Calothrix sp. PCC 6303]|nr:hypothetical protein Cal6303_5546 [Calothrix sp. PCC 6303]
MKLGFLIYSLSTELVVCQDKNDGCREVAMLRLYVFFGDVY